MSGREVRIAGLAYILGCCVATTGALVAILLETRKRK